MSVSIVSRAEGALTVNGKSDVEERKKLTFCTIVFYYFSV